jgi:uncharacterized repeat protein (TIGR01451 family)
MDGKKMKVLLLLAIMISMPVLALAQERPNLVLKLSAESEVIVKDENGKSRTEWREAKSFEPGDVLRYTIAYTNDGKTEARNAIIADPIPAGTTYVVNSAEGENTEITFSLDGKTFQVPPMLKYKVKSGASEQEFYATPQMYTHIRWKIGKPVLPGETGTVSFKVKGS